MYKAVISDLDGTLLNSQHRVSAFTSSTLAKGILMGNATERHLWLCQNILSLEAAMKMV